MAGNNSSVRWCGTCDTTNFPAVNSNNVGTSKRYEVDFSQDGATDGLALNYFAAASTVGGGVYYNDAFVVDADEAKTIANAALAQLGDADLLGLSGLGGSYGNVQKITIRCEMAAPQSGPHHSRVRFAGTADTTDFPAVDSSGLANTSVKYEFMLNQTGAAAAAGTDLSSYYVAGYFDYPYTGMLTADDAKLVANAVAAQVISYIGTSWGSSFYLRKVMIRCDIASP